MSLIPGLVVMTKKYSKTFKKGIVQSPKANVSAQRNKPAGADSS